MDKETQWPERTYSASFGSSGARLKRNSMAVEDSDFARISWPRSDLPVVGADMRHMSLQINAPDDSCAASAQTIVDAGLKTTQRSMR